MLGNDNIVFRIDIDIRNEIEAFHCNSASITSSAEVDQQTQLLTNIGASLGLCCPTDFSLIKVCYTMSLSKICFQNKYFIDFMHVAML